MFHCISSCSVPSEGPLAQRNEALPSFTKGRFGQRRSSSICGGALHPSPTTRQGTERSRHARRNSCLHQTYSLFRLGPGAWQTRWTPQQGDCYTGPGPLRGCSKPVLSAIAEIHGSRPQPRSYQKMLAFYRIKFPRRSTSPIAGLAWPGLA